MAETKRGYLKSRGFYVGVAPGTTEVYADRQAGGAWEEIEFTRRDDGRYTARFVAANLVLSVQPDGRFETRPAGTDGAFEQFGGGTAQGAGAILGALDVEASA